MQSAEVQDVGLPVMGSDQLARRVLAMVDSPPAWLGKRMRIHRLETDGDGEWGEVMDRLAVMVGLQVDFDEEGAVILQWGMVTKECVDNEGHVIVTREKLSDDDRSAE